MVHENCPIFTRRCLVPRARSCAAPAGCGCVRGPSVTSSCRSSCRTLTGAPCSNTERLVLHAAPQQDAAVLDCRDKPLRPGHSLVPGRGVAGAAAGTPVANLMLRNLPVPPLSIRPDNDQYNHPLTTLLSGILRTLARHRRIVATGGTPEALESCRGMLAKRVHDYFLCDTNSRTPGLCTRLLGKQGRMRNNLMGFRVNSAARAVITPDPYCPPWELRVPARVWDRLGLRDGETVLFTAASLLRVHQAPGPSQPEQLVLVLADGHGAVQRGLRRGRDEHAQAVVAGSAGGGPHAHGVEYNMVSPANGKAWVHLVQDCVLSEHLQGKSPARTTDARELHRRQVDAIDHLLARGFSIGLDVFLLKIAPVGDHVIDCVSRTADIVCDQLPRATRCCRWCGRAARAAR